jgi:hypothetical protein
MLTYFVRHTAAMDIDGATRQKLWNYDLIGVHFPHGTSDQLPSEDNRSIDPNDYRRGKRAIKLLNEMTQDGGYVCAEFAGHQGAKIGLVERGSKIELLEGGWGMKWGLSGRKAILKTLRLTKVKILNASEAAVLLVARPQQGTLNRWPNSGDAVRNLVEDLVAEPTLSSLHPSQQEVLCSEYMRSDGAVLRNLPRLQSLVALPGKTMKDVDIIGITSEGKRIFAQVTHKNIADANGKIEALKKFSLPGQYAVLFCQCEKQQNVDGIMVFPIQEVFSAFIESNWGKLWLDIARGK